MSNELEYNALPAMSIEANKTLVLDTLAWWQQCMQLKLFANAHKGYWPAASQDYLLQRLREEMQELEEAVVSGEDVMGECVDVANFAMMLADVLRQQGAQ